MCLYWSFIASHHNWISFFQFLIYKDDVNSGAETLNFLNLQNSGLRFTPEGKSLFQMILTEVDHVPHHVAHSVSRVSRCGTNGYISGGVFIFPERDNVQQTLLYELTDDLLQSHVELIFRVVSSASWSYLWCLAEHLISTRTACRFCSEPPRNALVFFSAGNFFVVFVLNGNFDEVK